MQSESEIPPEISTQIDTLVADLVTNYMSTGDGLAVLSGEQKAWKTLRKQCPAGRRVAVHEELRKKLNTALAPILVKIIENDAALDRYRELERKRGNGKCPS